MNFANLFLSFNGRTRRLHFWIGLIILWVIEAVIFSVFLGGAIAAAAAGGGGANGASAMFAGTGLIGCLLLLALVWPALAIQVKRWHDRDKSGWMVLINLIPLVGVLWTLIECGFLDGTPGPNKYGPSPKGLGGDAPAATPA
ncbi:MAG TPA: DUF805 domain-containing protein [Caulobacteraceae bacterium]|jgi:uncharacterized membrane protein YhaH (DUF805 family)|nr:DUF805 domain-containing protein [Caulobacteraceae bacterium]